MFNKSKNRTPIGIDISDGSIELASAVELPNGNIRLKEFARCEIAPDSITHGRITDTKQLASDMLSLFAVAQIDPRGVSAITALPDSQVIMKTVPVELDHTPTQSELEKLAQSVQVAENISLADSVRRWYFSRLSDSTGTITVCITKKAYIDQWRRFFKKIKIPIRDIEMESMALSRALIQRSNDAAEAILDLGYRTSSISVIRRNTIVYSHTIEFGGWDITAMLAHQLQITFADAEKLKIAAGTHSSEHADVAEMIRSKIKTITEELDLKNVCSSFAVSHMSITGGGALMPEITTLLHKLSATKTDIGKLWIQQSHKNVQSPESPISKDLEPLYAGAVGLALRNTNIQHHNTSINFAE